MACSLFVILAREPSRAVILRRGGTNRVRLILWHTDTDEFEPGQWFGGRIHGSLSDLSPDGSLFIYAACRQAQGGPQAQEYGFAWTAISHPPYLTALALWPAAKPGGGGGIDDGGGLFVDGSTILLDHRANMTEPHPNYKPRIDLKVTVPDKPHFGHPDPSGGGTLTTEFYRMVRDGWRVVHRIEFDRSGRWSTLVQPWLLERADPSGGPSLVLRDDHNYPWGGVGRRYFLRDKATGEEEWLAGAQWADFDHSGRLVFSREGHLLACLPGQRPADASLLADFTDHKFESIQAPEWATQW